MPKNINSAYRIKEILSSVGKMQDNTHMHVAWAEIFSINEKDKHKRIFSISRCLADLHDEVEFIRSEMLKLGYSTDLYTSSLDRCNNVFAVQSVTLTATNLKQHITPEVSVALGFCSEILPNEEDLIDEASIEELRKMASELRESLNNSTLPPYTINIIEKHLNKIEDAISTYKAIGAKALEEVMLAAYGEAIASEAVFVEAKNSEQMSLLSKIWKKTKTILDGAVDTNKKLGAMQGMTEKGLKVLEFIENFN